MNKSIITQNIQSLVTSLELTIEKLTAIISENQIYSEEQIDKQITLLQIKLEDDDNYKKASSKFDNLKSLLQQLRSEKNSLKLLINDVEFKNSFLNQQIDINNSSLSLEQKDIESLADCLNGSSNDEEISQLIKQKREKIEEIKEKINNFLEQIKVNDADIDFYKRKLESITLEEENYLYLIDQTEEVVVDETKKENDIKKLNRFLSIKNILVEVKTLKLIEEQLLSMCEYLENNRVNMEIINGKVGEFKAQLKKVNLELEFFINSINVNDLNAEKEVISKRVASKDGYVLNEVEKEDLYDQIASLQLAITVEENNSKFDEGVLIEYNYALEMLQSEVNAKELEYKMVEKYVNELRVKKAYFYNEYSQSQVDDINKEIKKNEKKLDNIKKLLDRFRQYKKDIENSITFVKKKRKSSDFLKDSKQSDLIAIKDVIVNGVTSKYNLTEDKQEILYIEFMNKLLDFSNYLLGQDYIKRLDELTLETIDPFVSVVGFYPYEHLDLIYSPEFLNFARNAIIRKLDEDVMRPEVYIEELNSQGIKVVKFGKSLKTMEDSYEMSKQVRLINE